MTQTLGLIGLVVFALLGCLFLYGINNHGTGWLVGGLIAGAAAPFTLEVTIGPESQEGLKDLRRL